MLGSPWGKQATLNQQDSPLNYVGSSCSRGISPFEPASFRPDAGIQEFYLEMPNTSVQGKQKNIGVK